MTAHPDNDYRERVFRLVRSIPRGRVMTYGQIAELLGEGYTPRTVGFVMHSSNDKTPWHRVSTPRVAVQPAAWCCHTINSNACWRRKG